VTKRVELIGNPLRRKHSQVIHDAAFAHTGIDARYELREIEPDDLAGFVDSARGEDWFGFQVTAPYKKDIRRLVDSVDPEVEIIGAVNSVVREPDGRLVGFNTDAPGFSAAVKLDLGIDLADSNVVVAGAGGAACAVGYAAVDGNAAEVVIGARDSAAAEELAARLGGGVGVALDSERYRDALRGADLFVNATTVGMLSPGPVIDVSLLPPTAAVFDLVYVPAETELIREARARGIEATNGAGMLVGQAVIAFRRWTGADDVTPVMREALEPLLVDAGEA
jgi:shikimate dehydrogenase